MTKEEIKALIAQTIEGQGDAVDVGGGLAKILNALADNSGGGSAVVVDGQFDTMSGTCIFMPKAGQTSYAEAVQLFRKGTPVFLKGETGTDVYAEVLVTSCGGEAGGVGLGLGGIFVERTSEDTANAKDVFWPEEL